MFVRDSFVGDCFLTFNTPIRNSADFLITSKSPIVSTTEAMFLKSAKQKDRGPSTTIKMQRNKENHSPGIKIVIHKYIHNYCLYPKSMLQFEKV